MPAGGDNDLTCSVLGRFFCVMVILRVFTYCFTKKNVVSLQPKIISRLERMLFTIGYNRFANCRNRLIMNKLRANTPPRKFNLYSHFFTKPTTCENRVSRGCFVLGGS